MRLLRAELGKLNRPLTWTVLIAIGMFSVLLAAGGASNAHRDLTGSADRVPSCTRMGLPEGPACVTALAMQRRRIQQAQASRLTSARQTAAQLSPVAAGAEAAGLLASLPGALAIALLAGGHVGGEWSGRTLKNLLTQHGRRWQVLTAKFISLWLAATALVAVCWAALAAAGPTLTHMNHLPAAHQSVAEAARWAGSQAARSLVVLAAFAAIGVLAAVLTRNTIGTMATTAAAFVAMLVLASLQSLGTWTPATWVQAWMGFAVGERSITDLPNNFWSRFIATGKSPPGHLFGLTGLLAVLVICAVSALGIFQRSDVA
jgi:ABC-type transport system involved in multi-copper enzyme maturation permease subunit